MKTLASYVPWLRDADDEWRLRIVLHDFGLLWQQTDRHQRLSLVADEPEPLGARWDAFLAAWVEHNCLHDELQAPDWVFGDSRYLESFWYPGRDLPALRAEAIVHSPAAFEVRGVLLAARELTVV